MKVRFVIRIFASLSMTAMLVFFTLRWSHLDMWACICLFLLLGLYFAFGNINYFYVKKMILIDGVFHQNGFLKGILSGKFMSFARSFAFGLMLSFVILFNLLHIDKFGFLYIFIASLLIFLASKFLLHFLFAKEFKNLEFIRIFDVCLSAILLSFLAIFLPQEQGLSPSVVAKFELLREIYSFKVLLGDFSHFLSLKFYIFKLIFALNEIGFYFAICYFVSLFFDYKKPKIGYFIGTIAILAYIAIILTLSLNLQKHEMASDTRVHRVVKFIINLDTNSSISLSLNEANEIKNSINNYQNTSLNEIKTYLDQSFETGARSVAREVGDFYFSFFADYIILFHSVVDDEKKYIENLFKDAIKRGFPEGMNDKIAMIIDKNFKLLNDEISLKISTIASAEGVNLQDNLNAKFLQDKKLRVSASAGASFGSMILAKVSAKSLAKFGSKMAASGTAASSGIACGTFAPLCSIAFAGATWVGFDLAFAKGEEAFGREKFEAEIYNLLMQEKAEILKNLDSELQKTYDIIRSQIVE